MNHEQVIRGAVLKDMILFATALLEKNKKQVDELNVFPVPDGDTGTNMSMTMNSAAKEIANADVDATIGEVSALMARGALRGARGNSGVILSQILRGMAHAFEGQEAADAQRWAQALSDGASAAYKAVLKPKEGTILTVIRYVAEKAMADVRKGQSVYHVIDNAVLHGEAILAKTPDMLPVLKEAGVVDSGGAGLLIVLRGFKMFLEGDVLGDETVLPMAAPITEPSASSMMENHDIISIENEQDIRYGYCTEFFVEHLHEGGDENDAENLLNELQKFGDSVVVVHDPELIKVHVHTDMPGKALQMALRLGELNGVKIENMREQHRQLVRERKAKEKAFGMVAVSMGEGLDKIFREVMVDVIVAGGQTMNPSAEDIEKAIKRVNARHVFVLPNNKNIVLAAKQAADLIEKSGQTRVTVIPTETITQGIAAALVFSDAQTLEEKETAMKEAADHARSGAITYAVRDTVIKGRSIAKGDFMGMVEGDIVSNGQTLDDVFETMIQTMMEDEGEFISIFYGQDVSERDAQAIAEHIEAQYPDADVVLQYGGQPLYYYFVSVE